MHSFPHSIMKKTLYLGLDPSRYPIEVTHYPIIEIRELANLQPYFDQLQNYDHVIFTSRSAILIYTKYAQIKRPVIAVGRATAALARQMGLFVSHTARLEQAEGVLEIIKELKSSFFFPHSAQARPLLQDYLKNERALVFPAYDTVTTSKKIDIKPYDAFVFTSPSTVKAFVELYGALPKKELIAMGPITQRALDVYSRYD